MKLQDMKIQDMNLRDMTNIVWHNTAKITGIDRNNNNEIFVMLCNFLSCNFMSYKMDVVFSALYENNLLENSLM